MMVFLRANKHSWPDLPTVQESSFEAFETKVEDHIGDMDDMSSNSDYRNLSMGPALLIIVFNLFGFTSSSYYHSRLQVLLCTLHMSTRVNHTLRCFASFAFVGLRLGYGLGSIRRESYKSMHKRVSYNLKGFC